jgi:hypothetical protein
LGRDCAETRGFGKPEPAKRVASPQFALQQGIAGE